MTPSSRLYPLSWSEAAALADAVRRRGGKVVTTNGCFDLLHAGHVQYLEDARKLGDALIVGLNSDASVKRLKGAERPLNSSDARACVLGALRAVDAVVVYEEDTPTEFLKTVRPDIHVKGGDWDPEKMPETPLIRSWGGRVEVLRFVDGFSTTGLIERARDKDPRR